MAEEKAASTETTPVPAAVQPGSKPYILIGLVVVNMLVVIGVGVMLYQGRKIEASKPGVDQVIQGEVHTQSDEAVKPDEIGKVIPLETFIVNLAGSKGRKVLKTNINLEVKGAEVIQEIENRKAQIRDFIIIILSSKSYDEVSAKEGKDAVKNEIKDNINSFLSKGKIVNVYLDEFIYN